MNVYGLPGNTKGSNLAGRSTYKVGAVYEDFICQAFGWSGDSSYESQMTLGDTSCGKEIKYDRKCRGSGRLFIETIERPFNSNDWHESTIMQSAKHLVIGDCSIVWVLEAGTVAQLSTSKFARWTKEKIQGRASGFLIRTDKIIDRVPYCVIPARPYEIEEPDAVRIEAVPFSLSVPVRKGKPFVLRKQ